MPRNPALGAEHAEQVQPHMLPMQNLPEAFEPCSCKSFTRLEVLVAITFAATRSPCLVLQALQRSMVRKPQ